ncbi:hypothetical protein [Thiococcus pfennigii]|jgi:hypothetical protein|uniref:hypothetical protein n=1 Tax=Thiococcus pfennigii TaxID=1057 RepID=UPI00190502ED|nr:hypothetical protein [Thiococcus pfennigii]MBK1700705.1 hypothetical protein [Thiococcus pfennigii]MBK1730347.1 hypothetical protein [Thiococcus pfennigii]
MSPARFDLLFSGALVPGTDLQEARQRLQELFRLTDETSYRLFSGQRVTVKRNVDEETAARYRERFRVAGALLQIVPVSTPEGPAEPEPPTTQADVAPNAQHLSLAPPGAVLGEVPRFATARAPAPDTSHLTLVAGDDWDLADCAPPRTAPTPPETPHLAMEAIEPRHTAADEPII